MNDFKFDARAKSISFDEEYMWLDLRDGRKLAVPLSKFPKLESAEKRVLETCLISGLGETLKWYELKEEISVETLLFGSEQPLSTNKLPAKKKNVKKKLEGLMDLFTTRRN